MGICAVPCLPIKKTISETRSGGTRSRRSRVLRFPVVLLGGWAGCLYIIVALLEQKDEPSQR